MGAWRWGGGGGGAPAAGGCKQSAIHPASHCKQPLVFSVPSHQTALGDGRFTKSQPRPRKGGELGGGGWVGGRAEQDHRFTVPSMRGQWAVQADDRGGGGGGGGEQDRRFRP